MNSIEEIEKILEVSELGFGEKFKNYHIVDVGNGFGDLVNYLKKTKKFSHVFGIDNQEMLTRAAKKYPDHKDCFKEGIGEKIPFEDGKIDVLIYQKVLHHIQDLKKACGEMNRVLKKGGYAIIAEPQKDVFGEEDYLGLMKHHHKHHHHHHHGHKEGHKHKEGKSECGHHHHDKKEGKEHQCKKDHHEEKEEKGKCCHHHKKECGHHHKDKDVKGKEHGHHHHKKDVMHVHHDMNKSFDLLQTIIDENLKGKLEFMKIDKKFVIEKSYEDFAQTMKEMGKRPKEDIKKHYEMLAKKKNVKFEDARLKYQIRLKIITKL